MNIVAKLFEALGIAILGIGYVSYLAGAPRTLLYYDFFIGLGVFYVGRYLEKRAKRSQPTIDEQHTNN